LGWKIATFQLNISWRRSDDEWWLVFTMVFIYQKGMSTSVPLESFSFVLTSQKIGDKAHLQLRYWSAVHLLGAKSGYIRLKNHSKGTSRQHSFSSASGNIYFSYSCSFLLFEFFCSKPCLPHFTYFYSIRRLRLYNLYCQVLIQLLIGVSLCCSKIWNKYLSVTILYYVIVEQSI
jgi:hypothetical protein